MAPKQKERFHEIMLLMFATKKLVWEHSKGFKDMDIFSVLRFAALQYILENDNPTMKQMAGYLRIKPSSATSLMAGLEKSGHIKRAADKGDRRIIRIHVTTKGEADFKKSFQRITGNMKALYSRLSAEEQNQLIKILKKINSHIIN